MSALASMFVIAINVSLH